MLMTNRSNRETGIQDAPENSGSKSQVIEKVQFSILKSGAN
jgi:hypothetical protein